MPIVLFRVDERLIHGQVVVGWGERLYIERIIVVDDELEDSSWEQELYCLGVPPSMEAIFSDVTGARREFPTWKADPRRTIVLLRNVETLERLAAGGVLAGEEVNIGGLHAAPGREGVLPYLFLSPEEREGLARIAGQGVHVAARDLPGSRAVPLEDLLGSA